MEKLEKVIKGLELCATFNACRASIDCPYKQEGSSFPICYDRLAMDALELLKEKQPKNVKDFQYVADLFIGKCPSCGEGLNNEVYPSFCGFCGQRISWKNSEQK